MQIENEVEKDEASNLSSEQWNLESQVIIDKAFLLTSIPNGENIQKEIKKIIQLLLSSFTSQLYNEKLLYRKIMKIRH
ncbi:MAG: hypothetical protein OCD00_16675 [Colwellia sp.]